ncbi:50S ribosomal protein L21 [Candidatus Arcanobacter lacustris]|jgi:large subunit ribosomal protein L21|uniref:Large ribosomal subunit protein bL21 n=1 Tax=Candidatus Arcanibacter lacustris TaxID=1607817 RepID=A0A0F5MPU0_9RICK|nr:50S ribosomal protein L21 [Candidatus Arcanobacter lacustris]
MFAVIRSGGKQYKVEKDYVVKLEKLDGEPGSEIKFEEILMIGESQKPVIIGCPLVKGASVTAEILAQARDPKIIVFKKKRRHNYRRKIGHRQNVTHVLIKEIKRA